MQKILLGFLFLFISCEQNLCKNQKLASAINQNQDQKCEAQSPTTSETEDQTSSDTEKPRIESEVPDEALAFDTEVTFYEFNETQKAKVLKALELIKKVIRSSEFKNKIMSYTYRGKREFIDNNGKSNEEVYQSLLDASEDLLPGRDHTMNLELELYYNRWTSTVGYTTPDTLRIWMNNKFFSSYTPAEVAGNIFHEWTHKLGYDHDSSYSESRDHSVPYALGYLIEELAGKM
jgi:hypothetical protein